MKKLVLLTFGLLLVTNIFAQKVPSKSMLKAGVKGDFKITKVGETPDKGIASKFVIITETEVTYDPEMRKKSTMSLSEYPKSTNSKSVKLSIKKVWD